MDTDLWLVLGLALGAIAIPSVLSAFADQRRSLGSLFLLFFAGGLVVASLTQSTRKYHVEDIPHVFVSVIGRLIH
jgi:hypothetical protein